MTPVRWFLAVLVLLIGVEAAWLGLVLPQRLSAAMVLVAPLLVTLPFVVSGGHRARLVACLLALPYFIHAVTEFAVGGSLFGLAAAGLCLALFAALILARRPPGGGA